MCIGTLTSGTHPTGGTIITVVAMLLLCSIHPNTVSSWPVQLSTAACDNGSPPPTTILTDWWIDAQYDIQLMDTCYVADTSSPTPTIANIFVNITGCLESAAAASLPGEDGNVSFTASSSGFQNVSITFIAANSNITGGYSGDSLPVFINISDVVFGGGVGVRCRFKDGCHPTAPS